MTLRGRPSMRALPGLRADGCTHILTLLSEREGARELGDACTAAGLGWFWLALPNGSPPPADVRARHEAAFPQIWSAIDAGGGVLIHCAAGIHRTGMVTYAMLRWRGFDRDAALSWLEQLRLHTRQGVVEKHLHWGDELASGRG